MGIERGNIFHDRVKVKKPEFFPDIGKCKA